MATWHQLQRPVPLYHKTMWNVVIDPPNEFRCLVGHKTKEEAQQYVDNFTKHHPEHKLFVHILEPVEST